MALLNYGSKKMEIGKYSSKELIEERPQVESWFSGVRSFALLLPAMGSQSLAPQVRQLSHELFNPRPHVHQIEITANGSPSLRNCTGIHRLSTSAQLVLHYRKPSIEYSPSIWEQFKAGQQACRPKGGIDYFRSPRYKTDTWTSDPGYWRMLPPPVISFTGPEQWIP